jgi:hypothetical protein
VDTLVSLGTAVKAQTTTAIKESVLVAGSVKLSDLDQRCLSDALMEAALAQARPDEVEMLKAGYALALERDRATSTR